jgi:hypothetical protein
MDHQDVPVAPIEAPTSPDTGYYQRWLAPTGQRGLHFAPELPPGMIFP